MPIRSLLCLINFKGQLDIKFFDPVLVVHMQIHHSQVSILLVLYPFFALLPILPVITVNRINFLPGVKDIQILDLYPIFPVKRGNPTRVLKIFINTLLDALLQNVKLLPFGGRFVPDQPRLILCYIWEDLFVLAEGYWAMGRILKADWLDFEVEGFVRWLFDKNLWFRTIVGSCLKFFLFWILLPLIFWYFLSYFLFIIADIILYDC